MAQEKRAMARPYAEAVLAYAKETNSFEAWSNMLNFLSTAVQTPAVMDLIANPQFSRYQVETFLLDIVNENFDAAGCNLLKVLFRNRRIFLAPEIADLYQQLRLKFQRIMQAEVISAYPLNDSQTEQLIAALKARLQHDIEIHAAQDPELIGGALIRVGGMVIDGSVRGQLQCLANQLRFLR